MRARRLLIALAVGFLPLGAFLAWERLAFDRAAWLSDYDQLRTHVSRNYANLLWAARHHDLDLAVLHQATLGRLEEADTDRAARAAIASFVAAFQDSHFRVHRTPLLRRFETLLSGEAAEFGPGTPADRACAALGFRDEGEGLAFASPTLSPLNAPDKAFPAGTFRLGERTAGMLRIPIFDQKRYRPACERAWKASIAEQACARGCTEAFVSAVVPNQLLSELADQVRALK